MKMGGILSYFGILALLVGCSGNRAGIPTFAVTKVPTQKIEPTSSETSVPTQQVEITSSVSSPTTIQVSTYPPETRTQTQCLNVETTPISEFGSSGILVLENRALLDEGRYQPGTIQLDMRSGQVTEITTTGENQIDHVVSPNKSLMAYESVIFSSEGKVTKEELVIADPTGNRLKTIPWEEEWWQTPVWSDNEHVVINLSPPDEENSDKKPLPMLVLNPFTNERRIIKPDFSAFPATSSANLPYWEGRWGAIYDPTLTYAVYPRIIENNEEMYTYAVWDLSKRRLVTTLDKIFSSFLLTGYFPIPKWSPDGSRFVFQSFDPTKDPVSIEMYEVNRDGQTKQLTQLAPVAYVWESSFSWSPDGRYIAMFLAPHLGAFYDKARVAVLDTVTLNIIDYCLSVTFSGDGYGRPGPLAPIWSPDSHEFIITDWYEKDHRRLILVDIEKNSAVQIADDMEPVGWMITP